MGRITIKADSLNTEELRSMLVAHRHAVQESDGPVSITRSDSDGWAFVGINGPEAWTFCSVALHPEDAAKVVNACVGAQR